MLIVNLCWHCLWYLALFTNIQIPGFW